MKILNTNQYISERVKVKPVTNAELDIVQKEMKSTMLYELPREYANLLKEWNVVIIRKPRKSSHLLNFVISADRFNTIFKNNKIFQSGYALVRYEDNVFYYKDCESFKQHFPSCSDDYMSIVKIIDAGIDFENVNLSITLYEMFKQYKNRYKHRNKR